jgi:predicted nucleic acid-binding Zn ribbon protein
VSEHRDEPVPLVDALRAVGRELGMPEPDALARLLAAWPEVVGAALAAHARVRSIRDGVLTIAVDEPAWATEVRYGADALARLVSERAGGVRVEHVRVVVERAP